MPNNTSSPNCIAHLSNRELEDVLLTPPRSLEDDIEEICTYIENMSSEELDALIADTNDLDLHDGFRIVLDPIQSAEFVRQLASDPEPNEDLKKAAIAYREWRDSDE